MKQIIRAAFHLAIKYDNGRNGFKLIALKWNVLSHASAMMTIFKIAASIDLLKLIHKQNLQDNYRNTKIALRIFFTRPVTTAIVMKEISVNLN